MNTAINSLKTWCVAAAAAMVLLTTASTAQAHPFGPNPNPHELLLAIGPAAVVRPADGGAAGRLQLTYGYHFFGKGEGPAIGGAFDLGFSKADAVTLTIAPRFFWDFLVADFLIIAPFIQMGVGIVTGYGDTIAAFEMAFGPEVKFCINDMWMLVARPFTWDIAAGRQAGASYTTASYNFTVGGGISF